MPLGSTLLDPLAFFRNVTESPPLALLSGQGEQELPEVSRRDLDLLIAEEDEAILLESRCLWQHRARLELDGQTPGVGSLGLDNVPISPFPSSEL